MSRYATDSNVPQLRRGFIRQVHGALLCMAAALAPVSETRAASDAADFLITNVNVVTMADSRVQRHMSVAVRDRKIVAIGPSGEFKNYAASVRVNGQGGYLIPGLSDMHVHLRIDPQDFLDLNLAAGVTTVFNMGIADGNGAVDHVALRADIRAGKIQGPRYLISGPQIDGEMVRSLQGVEKVLAEHQERGYDTVKIHGDLPSEIYDALIRGARERGFRVTGHGQHLMPLAQTLRMDCVEHVEELLYTTPGDAFAVDANFGVEKGGGIDNFLSAYLKNIERLKDASYRVGVVKQIASSGVYWDPTLIIYSMIPRYLSDASLKNLAAQRDLRYLPRAVRAESLDPAKNEYRVELAPRFSKFLNSAGGTTDLASHFDSNIGLLMRLIQELHEAGVSLLVGSDAFGAVVPGFATHQEMALLVQAGLTPFEALQAATVNPARYLREWDQAGTIEVGKRADFVLLGGNPLESIRNAQKVQGVYAQGRWHGTAELRRRLARVAANAQKK